MDEVSSYFCVFPYKSCLTFDLAVDRRITRTRGDAADWRCLVHFRVLRLRNLALPEVATNWRATAAQQLVH